MDLVRCCSSPLVSLVLVVMLVSGCSMTTSGRVGGSPSVAQSAMPARAVPKDQAEKIAKERIEALPGGAVQSVVCNGPLEAIVGATQRCVLTQGGERAGVTLTVTKIQGDKVDFSVKIDDHLLPD